eukprot:TRINITY_DN358_c0_g1_i1.p1 TRINITY_DN358_c0_g1~~TRINITY_DN358_c0_g1_i1.p1  ORF type:complete len:1045 (-),score=181.70 TRINITY_DN358_c0_g1_i1:6764-9898(-)
MEATTSSTSSPRQHAPSRRELPHTLSIINNVQNAIAAIEHRLEHNPSAQPPPPQRNEYPAQQGNNRDKIYSATVKHLEQPVVLPQYNSPHLSAPTVDADAVLSPQSTFSSLAIDEAVSVTSDYQVSTTFGSPAPRLSVSTTRSIADIVQHFESNSAANALSRDSSSTKHSSPSIAPIVDRFESEQRVSDASRPASSIAPIVEQFQRPANTKSSVSFAQATHTFTTASKDNTPALEDDVDLSSVGATVDPSEFDFSADEADRMSQRAFSATSISKSERDVPAHVTSPLPPSQPRDTAGLPAKRDGDDAFEGSTVNVDALSKSLQVDTNDLEVTDESVARAIKTLDTYSIAAGVQTSKHERVQSEKGRVAARQCNENETCASAADISPGGKDAQEDISAPIDDSFAEGPKSVRGADMEHAAVRVNESVSGAQPSVPTPVAQKSNIPGVELNSRSFTITSTTISSKVQNDGSRLERVSVIETVETGTIQIRDSENSTPADTTEQYSSCNPSQLRGVAEDQIVPTSQSASDIACVAAASSTKPNMAAPESSASAFVSPPDIGNVANVSTVRKVQNLDEMAPGEAVAAVSVRQTASSTVEHVHEHVGDTSRAAHEVVGKVVNDDTDMVSDSASETNSCTPLTSIGRGASDVADSPMAQSTISTTAATSVQEVRDAAQEDIKPVAVQDVQVDLEVKEEAQECSSQTAPADSAEVASANGQSQATAAKPVRAETRRTLTPSRIPRRLPNSASPANSTASSTRMETRESDGEANARRRMAGCMTPTSLSPGCRIMSSRLPPSRASSSGTLTPSSRSAATSPKGLSPLRGRGGAPQVPQQPRRPASTGAARSLSNDRKGVKLPRVADLLNARNRDRASASPGRRLPRGSTFSGVAPVGLGGGAGQVGVGRRMGTTSSPVTPNNRPKTSPQGMGDMTPLHTPLRRTLSFNNNRRATLSPSNIRGVAASSKLQDVRGSSGAGSSRRATLSETRRPPRQRVTVPEPFHLTGAELQAKALKQMEEQRRKREEMDRRRRVFRARPMPDFSNPSPRPFL